jgi:hypothetical protein
MEKSKQIQIEDWIEHLSLFTNGNKGRLVSISTEDSEMGNNRLADKLPLMAIDYDPLKKGDDILISLGGESADFRHEINAPVEMWETHNDLGVVILMEIIDQNNNKVILAFDS